ncbi:hypothetical protein [Kutzneria sp. NPDC052558]|uniref:hypothetical protein n=1 Tax=Kutzneria sp. NPDC052558 TaxID=3364121 RepID=UPI0037C94825
MRAKVVVTVALGSMFALTACGASAAGTPPTKSEICAQALGSAVLGQLGSAAQSSADHAKQLADTLQQLSTQAQDQQLAKALADAAQTAGEATLKHLTDGDLAKWAETEAAKLDAVRQACTS